METHFESLTPEEFFSGYRSNQSGLSTNGSNQTFWTIGNVLICVVIGGVIVYIFRDEIEGFLDRLSRKSYNDLD